MSGATDLAGLLPDLESAFGEIARTALGIAEVVRQGEVGDSYPHLQGAYLPLTSPQGAIQIGIASDEGGCQAFARGLLSMTEADGPLAPAEMADAFCEIANIVAGAFKRRIADRAGAMTLGLPVFFHGPPQASEHTAVEAVMLRAGATAAALLLVYPRAPHAAR